MYDVAERWCGWDRMRFHHHRFFRAHQYPRSAFTMINLPCGSSRTRRCLGMSGRARSVLADVLHFRRFRVREATDRTPRFSVLLGCHSSVPAVLSRSLPPSHFGVSGRRSWHGEGARCGGRRE